MKFKLEGSRFKTVYAITCYGGLVAPLKSSDAGWSSVKAKDKTECAIFPDLITILPLAEPPRVAKEVTSALPG